MTIQTHKSAVRYFVENCIVPNMEQIKPANGYRSDVKQVAIPDYQFNEATEGVVYGYVNECGIMIWVTESGNPVTVTRTSIGGDGTMRFSVDVSFIGVVKNRGGGVAGRSWDLMEDHKRAVVRNPSQYQPNSTVSTGGIDATLVEPYRFSLGKPDEGIGAWSCTYRFDYEHPAPRG